MEIIVTDAALDCGFFKSGESPERLNEIESCARSAVKTNLAFKFGYAEFGDDSLICNIAARDSSEQFWWYFYDSDVTGGGGGPSALNIHKCETLTFEPEAVGKYGFFYLENCVPDEELNAILRR